MIPTRESCISFAQFLLGDPNGNQFASSYVGTAVDAAYREWLTQCDINQIPQAKFTAFYWLPAFTAQFTPAQASISNFGEIITLEEQNIASTAAISASNNSSPIQITTSTPHLLSQNQEFMTFGAGGDSGINGRWLANVISPTVVGLPGSLTQGTYTTGGNVVLPDSSTSSNSWTQLMMVSELPDRLPQDFLLEYVIEHETFYFVGADKDRLLRIIYYASGTPPASGSLGYDNIQDFISYRAGAIAGGTRDMARAAQLATDAQVFLDALLDEHVRALQRQPVRPKAYKAGGYTNAFNSWPYMRP